MLLDWLYAQLYALEIFQKISQNHLTETLNTCTQTFSTKHIIGFIENSDKFFAVILNFGTYGIYFIGGQITQSKCFTNKFVYFLAIKNRRSVCYSMKCFAENTVSSKYKRSFNSPCVTNALL